MPEEQVPFDVEVLYTIGDGPTRVAQVNTSSTDEDHAEEQARSQVRERLITAGHLDPDAEFHIVKVNTRAREAGSL